ncbi:LuxR C-terminal-related transcriptional regulator [Mangrovibacterium lignilyticum]|uniref:LuxR C-terminal-related transcriptional regulator n=1 Tax=Mangrovibacterium lignilyticum TaxID=2668052 RepID=UPI0013D8A7AC|nr:response regulator transcription factor [Mangrovibacterium lignilyticum]
MKFISTYKAQILYSRQINYIRNFPYIKFVKKRIVIVGDYHILRRGLEMLFKEDKRFEVVGEASNSGELYSVLKEEIPNIVLLDLMLPQDDVVSILKNLRDKFPGVLVVALAVGSSEGAVLDAVMLGVRGIIWKESSWDDLITAINCVVGGETYFEMPTTRMVSKVFEHLHKVNIQKTELLGLSPREKQVLKLIAEGNSYKQIANILSISPRTVESHKNNMLDKLNLTTQVDLVKYAMRARLVE